MQRNRIPRCGSRNSEGLLGEYGMGSGFGEGAGAIGGGT